MPKTSANRRRQHSCTAKNLELTFLHSYSTAYENYSHTIALFTALFSQNILHEDRSPSHNRKISHYIHTRTSTGSKTRRSQMWILLLLPSTEWPKVWTNSHIVPINDVVRSKWYRTIHHDYWRRFACFKSIVSPLPNVPTQCPRHSTSSIVGMQRNYWHIVLDKRQNCHQPSVTSSSHICFSQ